MPRRTATTRRASAAARIRADVVVALSGILIGWSSIGCSSADEAAPLDDITDDANAETGSSSDGSTSDADARPLDEALDVANETRDASVFDTRGTEASTSDVARDGDANMWCPTDPDARPNEGLAEEPGVGGCPSGMVPVSTFCVDRFEASLVIVDGANVTSWSPYYPPPSSATYKAVSLRGAVPQGYISGAQAKRACEAAGKRLCTNPEWLRACRGPNDDTYPYGDARRPGVCNDARTGHPAATCFGTTDGWIYSRLDYPGINQQSNTVDRTGANAECVSAEGLFDMMGNLHEWIFDDPAQYADPTKAIDFRGGFYADTKINGEGCLYRTTAHGFTHWDYSTGFRCCAD